MKVLNSGKPQKKDINNQYPYYFSNMNDLIMHILEKVGFERLKKTNLTFDNLYTSLEVVKALREKQVSVIGTLRSNRKAVNCKEFWGKKLFLNILKQITTRLIVILLNFSIWYFMWSGKITMEKLFQI